MPKDPDDPKPVNQSTASKSAILIVTSDLLFDLSISRPDPRAEIISKAVIECAQTGETNLTRLRDMVRKKLPQYRRTWRLPPSP